jgi:hypothetical protein
VGGQGSDVEIVMDKPSERKKDVKECGDTDIGVHDYGAGGKREQTAGLWSIPSKEVVGLGPERILTNCYCKELPGEKAEKRDLMDEIIEHGPPLLNTSKPRRVF